MKRWLVLVALLFGCCELEGDGAREAVELGELEQEAIIPGESFGFKVTEREELVRSVLDRWERATCMRFEITDDGPHTIRFADRVPTGGHIGGTWEAARIDVQTHNWTDSQIKVPLTHEIAHLLALTNEHLDRSVLAGEWQFNRSNQVISAPLLAMICRVRECGCFSPEG